jgi:hypothetical protein
MKNYEVKTEVIELLEHNKVEIANGYVALTILTRSHNSEKQKKFKLSIGKKKTYINLVMDPDNNYKLEGIEGKIFKKGIKKKKILIPKFLESNIFVKFDGEYKGHKK